MERDRQKQTTTPDCNRAIQRKIKWARGIERRGIVGREGLIEQVTSDLLREGDVKKRAMGISRGKHSRQRKRQVQRPFYAQGVAQRPVCLECSE